MSQPRIPKRAEQRSRNLELLLLVIINSILIIRARFIIIYLTSTSAIVWTMDSDTVSVLDKEVDEEIMNGRLDMDEVNSRRLMGSKGGPNFPS